MPDQIALSSFPRSGNTWLRHALFNAFGWKSWCAHGYEFDSVHRAALIPLLADRDARLIKTHLSSAAGFDHCIHLVRNPLDAIGSYLRYQEQWCQPVLNRRAFIEREAVGWTTHTGYWTSGGRVSGHYLRVRYSELMESLQLVLVWIGQTFEAKVEAPAIADAVSRTRLECLQKLSGGDRFFWQGGYVSRDQLTAAEKEMVTAICGHYIGDLDL